MEWRLLLAIAQRARTLLISLSYTTFDNNPVNIVRDQGKQAEHESIAQAEDISASDYEKLKPKKAKTEAERHQERKFELKQRYQTEEIDPDLIEKDRCGWHPQLRLHYYLTVGKQHLKERELAALTTNLTPNGVWMPTFNRAQISAKVWLMETLGVLALR